MSLAVITADLTVLPLALLPLAKQHMRIDWNGEDDFIKSVVARAIGRMQDKTDMTINPSTFRWTPAAGTFNGNGATLPVCPVSAFSASSGDPPVDVSGEYAIELKWETAAGPPLQIMTGAAVSGVSFILTAGMPPAGPDVLPASILDVLLRYTSHLYEHREILVAGREFVSPDLASELVWWRPRV